MAGPKLAKLELQIMDTLWKRGSASIREIQEAFPEEGRPAYTTIQTTVYRLEGKKAVRRVKKVGNFHVFEPAVSRDAAQRKLVDDLLALFGGRTQPVMARLIESGQLTLEDVKEAEKTSPQTGEEGQNEMTPEHLSAILPTMWREIAPALGNHLWQSTVFAAAAGLLTLILRKNHARARYWLWLAASVKFLIPFSLLVNLGNLLSWSRGSAGIKAPLYFVIEEVSQPFQQSASPAISPSSSAMVSPNPLHWLPAVFLTVWFCGFVMVLFVWCLRWRRVSAAMREAAPLLEGREVEALRRLEPIAGKPIEIVLSRDFSGTGNFRNIPPGLDLAARDLRTP